MIKMLNVNSQALHEIAATMKELAEQKDMVSRVESDMKESLTYLDE